MAKKKGRKSEADKKAGFLVSLSGVALTLAAILGIGKYGIAGRVIASFMLFLVGNAYIFLLIILGIVGILMFIKNEKFNFFTTKMLGVYLFSIGILVSIHQNYLINHLEEGTKKILSATIDNIWAGIDKIMSLEVKPGLYNPVLANTGGGFFGGIFSTVFNALFDNNGTTIVVWVIIISGIVIFTGFSIVDFMKKAKEKLTDMTTSEEKPGKIKPDKQNDVVPLPKIVDHNDAKLVVNDISEITKMGKEMPVVINSDETISEIVEINQNYQLPPLSLLNAPNNKKVVTDHTLIEKNITSLEKVLSDFGIVGRVVEVNIGPTVTQYEIELNSGTKVSSLLGINREISLALAKKDIRIQAPIPGKKTVGVEMPNDIFQIVTLREVIELMPKSLNKSLLSVALGKDLMGNPKWCEIDMTPHLLIAGATGSGKSVCINDIIISILMKAKPDEVKLILIDPKKVELSVYNGVPHLATPVVTEPRKAAKALKKALDEMSDRYDLFEKAKVKNIASYNKTVSKEQRLPYIVIIVDELADLMFVARKEVEDLVTRITQMARAAGIHLVIATQRPSTDVITGLIKANIPSRIAFAVTNGIDSRTIIDMMGAEKLLSKGDMLYIPMGESIPVRIQCSFVSEEEIKRVVDHTIAQQKASYDKKWDVDTLDQEEKQDFQPLGSEDYDDPLYNEIVEFVVTSGKASASLLQRRFKLGYNRAARIVDLLEDRGIIGPQNGSKPREVLVKIDSGE